MPRGRPPKNKVNIDAKNLQAKEILPEETPQVKENSPSEENIQTKETSQAKENSPAKERFFKESKYIKCDLCLAPIPSGPRIINISQLTGFASWHFDYVPIIHVCNDCAEEFKEYVEKWLNKKEAPKKKYC